MDKSRRKTQSRIPAFLAVLIYFSITLIAPNASGAEAANEPPVPPIPITISLDQPGYVTLVIDDQDGKRVRNLFSGEYFEAGKHVIPWDGLGEGEPLHVPRAAGYTIQRNIVALGQYQIHGIVRDKITLEYEFTVYPNVKGTPWVTDSGKMEGGWLADHGNVHASLFIPAERSPEGVDTMLLSSSVAEAGHGLAWTDIDGNKVAGQRRLGGTWTAASHLAYDWGKKVHPEIYAFGRMDWASKKEGMGQIRITGISQGRNDLRVRRRVKNGDDRRVAWTDDLKVVWTDIAYEWNGGHPGAMAVHNNVLAFSVFGPGRIFFYDTSGVTDDQQATLRAEVPMEEPNALAFDPQGRLLVVDGATLLRYPMHPFPNEPRRHPAFYRRRAFGRHAFQLSQRGGASLELPRASAWNGRYGCEPKR